MPIVHCPACQKRSRVPDSDTTLHAQCPHCQHAFEVPGQAAVKERFDPPIPPEPPPLPAPRSAPRSPDTDFDFEGRHSGSGPTVRRSGFPARKHTLIPSNILLVGGILGLVVALLQSLLTCTMIGSRPGGGGEAYLAGMVCGMILRGGILIPVILGATALSKGRGYGMAMAGAICALVASLFYGVGFFGVFALLDGQPMGGLIALFGVLLGLIGVMLFAGGIYALIVLCNREVSKQFDGGSPRFSSRRDLDD